MTFITTQTCVIVSRLSDKYIAMIQALIRPCTLSFCLIQSSPTSSWDRTVPPEVAAGSGQSVAASHSQLVAAGSGQGSRWLPHTHS